MKKNSRTILLAMLMLSSVLAVLAIMPSVSLVSSRTYTLDADFDEGTLTGVEHDTVHDQLQLSMEVTTFPIMWIANAGEDTVSKWNTTSNRELARYRTWFGPAGQPGYFNHLGNAWAGASPSRTAVDPEGNAYVGNRHFDNRPADVIKILADDWIDRNGNGIMDTSTDSNNNGVIDPAEILPMGDTNGNGQIDVGEIQDERMAWAVSVGPANGLGRSLAIAPNDDIWLGLYNSKTYYRLSNVDGSILGGPFSVGTHTPYGALIDANGILWGASLSTNLLKLNTSNPAIYTIYSHASYGYNYGIALGTGGAGQTIVYLAEQGFGRTYIRFDSATATFSNPAALWFSALGVAVDSNGDIFASRYSGVGVGGVAKFRPDGSLIWQAAAQVASEARGTIVDANDDVWVIHRAASQLSKFRGSDGAALGVVNSGDQPYTYTDATGLALRSAIGGIGFWTVVFDSGAAGTPWGTVSWGSNEPTGTSITVEVRSSEDLTSWSPWETATNGVPLSATPNGRYLQIKTTLRIFTGDVSPILFDLTVETAIPELEFECFMTDSEFNIIERFDTVWTPKDMKKTVFKLASTNPGQFMWNMKLHNTWPVPIDTITINYDMDDDFILKGADPIQVHDGYGKTGTRIPATVTYGDTGSITIDSIAPSTTLYITLHLEYGPARDYFDKDTMLAWKALHEPNIFLCDYVATGTFSFGTVTRSGSCSLTLPDPLVILAVEE